MHPEGSSNGSEKSQPFLKAVIVTMDELRACAMKSEITTTPLRVRQFIGNINRFRGASKQPPLTLFDFLESMYRLSTGERGEILKHLDGKAKTLIAAYEPVRMAIGNITSSDRNERLALLVATLGRSERSVMEYLRSIDADKAFLGVSMRGRKARVEVNESHDSLKPKGVQQVYADVIAVLGKQANESTIADALARHPYNMKVTKELVALVLAQPKNSALRALIEQAQRE